MSYPRDLDEYNEHELYDEILRRRHRRLQGKCDYCNRPPTEHSCRFPERHEGCELAEDDFLASQGIDVALFQ